MQKSDSLRPLSYPIEESYCATTENENHTHLCTSIVHATFSESNGEFAFMSDISELFMRCVELHKAGEHAVAAQGYAAILRADPTHADAWHLSGLLAHQAGLLTQLTTSAGQQS